MATFTTDLKNIKNLYNMYKNNQLDDSITMQRAYVWDRLTKSNLIASLIYGKNAQYGMPVDTLLFSKSEDFNDSGVYKVLNGKQRLNAIMGFLNNSYSISSKIEEKVRYYTCSDGSVVDLANTKFSDWNNEMQSKLFDRPLTISVTDFLTYEEMKLIFLMVNQQSSLTSTEKNRSKLTEDNIEFFTNLCQMDFMKYKVYLGKQQINRFEDFSILLQILLLIRNNGDTSFTKPAIDNLSDELAKNELPEEEKQILIETLQYLAQCFPIPKVNSLKRVHIPMVFYTAREAMDMNIEPLRFGGWWLDFADQLDNGLLPEYKSSIQGGTTSKQSVTNRLSIMIEHFHNNIDDAERFDIDKAGLNQSKYVENV